MPGLGGGDAEQVQSAALAFLKDPERRHQWRVFYDFAYPVPPVYLGHGEWLLASRDDVISALKNEGAQLTALYPVTRSPAINELFLGTLPFEHGADHRRLRSLTSMLFSATAI